MENVAERKEEAEKGGNRERKKERKKLCSSLDNYVRAPPTHSTKSSRACTYTRRGNN